MKVFNDKSKIQKITIVLVLVTCLNFMIPKPVSADIGGFLLGPIMSLFTGVVDVVYNAVQSFMLGEDSMKLSFMVNPVDSDQFYGALDKPAAEVEVDASNFDGGFLGLKHYGVPVIKYSPEEIFGNKT